MDFDNRLSVPNLEAKHDALRPSGSFRERRHYVDSLINPYEQLQLQQLQANTALNPHFQQQAIQTINCVVEGDLQVGRSSLLKVYTGESAELDEDASPPTTTTYNNNHNNNNNNNNRTDGFWENQPRKESALRNFSAELTMDGRPIYLILHETAAGADYDHLRRLHYAEADCFVLCFSVVKPESFESIREYWFLEVMEHCRKWPTIVLVGTMVDLREDAAMVAALAARGRQPVTCEQGMRLAKDLKAARYLECSARTRIGVNTVFHEAVRAVLAPPVIPTGTKLPKQLQDDWACQLM